MPPPLCRGSMSSFPRCVPQFNSISSRSFTTSHRLSSIGPESPRFIEVPIAPQRYAKLDRDIKGTLPPPRNIFPSRYPERTTDAYVEAVTRAPTSPKKLREPANERVAWKRQMAETRRTNLRESLVELRKRHLAEEYRVSKTSERKMRINKARTYAPQREDERLTSPTVTAAVKQLQVGAVPDPGREQRIAEKKERVAAKEAAREEQRKDSLHTLYMNARDFIVTEEQLDAEIEKIFVPAPFPGHAGKTNIWDAYNAPQTIQDMLTGINGTSKAASDFYSKPGVDVGKRMKKIAEELTGGKMD